MKNFKSVAEAAVSDLLGKTLTAIDVLRGCDDDWSKGRDMIVFTCGDGSRYLMYHYQDCCEEVVIKDITGDPATLIGSPLVMAEEVSSERREVQNGTETWTFYKFANEAGHYVTISWLGESNGYYSETVDFGRIEEEL